MSRISGNKNESRGRLRREVTKSDVFIIASNYILAEKQNKNKKVDNKTKN